MKQLNYSKPKDHELLIWDYLTKLKEFSNCWDKQVACAIVHYGSGGAPHWKIVAQGVNRILQCDRNCHDKENRLCETSHAEMEALESLSSVFNKHNLVAYVNLFPCVPCQMALDRFVSRICVFGYVHKDIWSSNITMFPDTNADRLDILGSEEIHNELYESATNFEQYSTLTANKAIDSLLEMELNIEAVKRYWWEKNPQLYNEILVKRSSMLNEINEYLEQDYN